jgi:hypothetical protein
MKKLFGVLSLIAILMLSVSNVHAYGLTDDVSIECQAYPDSPDIVAVEMVNVSMDYVPIESFSLDDVSVTNLFSDACEVVFISRNIFSTNLNSKEILLPIEVGLLNTSFNSTNLNRHSKIINKNGYEVPDIVSRISANVGKLTKPILNS